MAYGAAKILNYIVALNIDGPKWQLKALKFPAVS